MIGFLVILCSLRFCRNIAKDKFIIDKFFIIKKFDLKKNNTGFRLMAHLDLWTENYKTEVKPLLEKKNYFWKVSVFQEFNYQKNSLTQDRLTLHDLIKIMEHVSGLLDLRKHLDFIAFSS